MGRFQTLRSGLYRIAHHQNGRLLRERNRTGVTEVGFIGFRIQIFLLLVEIVHQRRSVVGTNKVNYPVWKFVLARDFDSIEHVVQNNLGTFFRRQIVVGVHIGHLVLGIEGRSRHFTYVVVQGPYPHQKRISANLVGRGFGQIGHLQGMVERPGSLVQKAA